MGLGGAKARTGWGNMLSIGWFSTGRGEGSQGLLRFVQERILQGSLDAQIEFVFSNRERGEAEGSDQYFRLVEDYGIHLETLSSAKFRKGKRGPFAQHREEYDALVMGRVNAFQPDVCVLAGYMLIVGGKMCRRFSLLNLHPALPDGPTGTWQEVIWSLIENRAEQTGAMVHLATEDVDRGPVISHCTVPITGGEFAPHWSGLAGQDLKTVRESQGEEFPLFQLIRQAEYRKEPYLLAETLRAVVDGKVVIEDGQVLDSSGQPLAATAPGGLRLDLEIDHEIDRVMARG